MSGVEGIIDPVLVVEDLVKAYDGLTAVDHASFSLGRGETVVLMGPSGCGKSTVIRCINRLTEPDSGMVSINGVDARGLDAVGMAKLRQGIGYVFQNFNLVGRLTCLDNVALRLLAQGYGTAEARDRAKAALDMVGLYDKLGCMPKELSGGQQQRVAIARAVAGDPFLLLWDEPTASLDPILVREVLDLMDLLAGKGTTAMVVVTHELAFVRRSANKVILMEKGRFVEEGVPGAVFASPSSEVGRRYKEILEYF